MTNERLRAQLTHTGLTANALADRLQVDPKTVERWISKDRVPHPRHRVSTAQLLGTDETYLWPSVANGTRAIATSQAEFRQLYPNRGAIPAPLWASLIANATQAIDILVYSGLFLFDAQGELVTTMRDKSQGGAKVRVAVGDESSDAVRLRGQEEGIGEDLAARIRLTKSTVAPLRGMPGVEVRQHATVLYTSMYRFDDDLLVNLHMYGAQAPQSPVLHLQRVPGGRLFDSYLGAFDRVWETAQPLWE